MATASLEDFRTGDKPCFGDFVVLNLVDGDEFDVTRAFGECASDAFVIDDIALHSQGCRRTKWSAA